MMKIYFILACLLVTASCKKENANIKVSDTTSKVNTEVVYGTPSLQDGAQSLISATDKDTLINLLKVNNLPVDNQVFYEYQSYYALDQGNKRAYFQVAYATQLSNGLPIFFYEFQYGFENGVILASPGTRYGNLPLDNKATLPLQTLQQSFINSALKLSSPLSFKGSDLAQQLGYYDLNIGFPDKGVNFVKAWEVHPKDSQLPLAYFRDDNGGLISLIPPHVPGTP